MRSLAIALCTVAIAACAELSRPASTSPDTLPFTGCWAFAWDSRAGLWDAPLPRELMLLSEHAEPHPDDAEYREARLAYYREPVLEGFSDRDLLFRHNTIWRLVGSDSLRVLLSWQSPPGPPRYELRALGTSERLEGTLGVQLRAGFDSLLTFTAARETCPANGVVKDVRLGSERGDP
ncbi:MAG TPA: hypothetical protein VFK13_07505 [Gemmatimonadaceae bacterium]|nr:hypothetical protein [Gemmatimonadaceae bacterium]